jgi:autoinducer 2-degrading protein
MVVLWIEHRVHAERVEAYLEATLANARTTRGEPGNVRFDVLRDPDDPTRFVLYEAYVDEAAQKAHLASAHFAAWRGAAGGAIAESRVERWSALHVPG